MNVFRKFCVFVPSISQPSLQTSIAGPSVGPRLHSACGYNAK